MRFISSTSNPVSLVKSVIIVLISLSNCSFSLFEILRISRSSLVGSVIFCSPYSSFLPILYHLSLYLPQVPYLLSGHLWERCRVLLYFLDHRLWVRIYMLWENC